MGCKDIGIRKSEFVKKLDSFLTFLKTDWFQSYLPRNSCWCARFLSWDDQTSSILKKDEKRSWLDSYSYRGGRERENASTYIPWTQKVGSYIKITFNIFHTILKLFFNFRPGPIFRGVVVFTQLSFTAGFSLAYLISPHFCHRYIYS